MAEFESILSVLGGLNTDDALLNSGDTFQSDYRYARNIRIGSSVEDNTGGAETIPSSLLVNSYYQWNGSAFASGSAPAGTFTCIGKYEDISEGKLYFACYNSSGNHVILMFDKVARIIYEILQWTGLNFNLSYPVQFTKINKYFIITDKLNPPRMFDSTDVYALKQTLGSNFSEYHLTLAKWAPLAPAQVRRISGASPTNTELTHGMRQFSYRYVYKGGFKSTFAPWSIFVTNEIDRRDYNFELYLPGFIFDYETPANEAFNHDSVKFYEWVEFIELVYRESEQDGWKLWQRHAVTSGSNSTFTYSNNGPIAGVPQNQILQPFDSVPLLSGTVEAIDNRPMLGDNDDEFPAVTDFDVEDVEVYISDVDPATNSWNTPASAFTSLSAGQRDILSRQMAIKRFSFKERGIYKLAIQFQHWSGRTNLATSLDEWKYTIPGTAPFSKAKIYSLGFNIPGGVTPPDWAVAYQIVRTNCLNIPYFIHGEVNDFQILKDDPNAITDNVTTPDGVQTVLNDFYDNDSERLPLSKRLFQIIRKTQSAATISSTSFIYMDIRNWFIPQLGLGDIGLPANNVFYSFREGDRVRFWGSDDGSFTIDHLVQYEEEVIAFTGNGIIVKKPDGLVGFKVRSEALNLEMLYKIEIYRRVEFNEDDTVPYYEMGEWYPILNPGTPSRDFSKRDFRWTNSASVTASTVAGHTILNKMPITNGDVWVVNKQFFFKYVNALFNGISVTAQWMQMTPDKTTGAQTPWEHNTGRPVAAYLYLPVNENKPTQVRFGGKFLEDSVFISINTFRDEWQFIYPSEYGRIRKLVNTNNAQVESVGNILIALGEDQPWSIYVNRATLEDISGRTQVTVSDKVLGSYNTLLGSFGCINPESVAIQDGKVIWWSEKKGAWVRYARDGITNISNRKMKNWYKDLSELIRNTYSTSTPAKVLAVFDEYHERWLTRIDHSSLPATFKGYSSYKCTTFSEVDGRWKEHLDFAPDYFGSIDTEIYSIKGRTIYIHEAGADYLNLDGSVVTPQIELASAIEPRKVKDWRAVALDATDKWSFESIKGDWRSNSATLQETRIKLGSLDLREGVYWSEIKKDMNSPNAASQEAGVVNGNPMKSRTLRLLIQLDPDVDYLSVFNWLIVSYDGSPKNPKN